MLALYTCSKYLCTAQWSREKLNFPCTVSATLRNWAITWCKRIPTIDACTFIKVVHFTDFNTGVFTYQLPELQDWGGVFCSISNWMRGSSEPSNSLPPWLHHCPYAFVYQSVNLKFYMDENSLIMAYRKVFKLDCEVVNGSIRVAWASWSFC